MGYFKDRFLTGFYIISSTILVGCMSPESNHENDTIDKTNHTINYESYFRDSPNWEFTSVKPAPVADESKDLAESFGFTLKSWNYRFIRLLFSIAAPNPDKKGLIVQEEEVGEDKAIIVIPKNKTADGAVFFIHGGGLVVGSNSQVLTYAYYWARKLGVTVILPSYSLAPQHPFPKGLNDLYETWSWLQKNSNKLQINPSKVVIGGSSAGGGLAAALTQRLVDEKVMLPAAQFLIYPMLDDRTAVRKDLQNTDHPIWNNRSNFFGWKSYLAMEPGSEKVPLYSVPARKENLKGLPPTWIGVGNADLFIDEDRIYAKKLRDAGVAVSYLEIDGAIHSFDSSENKVTDLFRKKHSMFISKFIN